LFHIFIFNFYYGSIKLHFSNLKLKGLFNVSVSVGIISDLNNKTKYEHLCIAF